MLPEVTMHLSLVVDSKTRNSLKKIVLAKKSWQESSLQSRRTYSGRQLGRQSRLLLLERTTNGRLMVVTDDFWCRNMVVTDDFWCRNMVVPDDFCCRNMVVPDDFWCSNMVVRDDFRGSNMLVTYDFGGSRTLEVVTCRHLRLWRSSHGCKKHGRAVCMPRTKSEFFVLFYSYNKIWYNTISSDMLVSDTIKHSR